MQSLPQFLTTPARMVCNRGFVCKVHIWSENDSVQMLLSFSRDPKSVFQDTFAFHSAGINGDDFLFLSAL